MWNLIIYNSHRRSRRRRKQLMGIGQTKSLLLPMPPVRNSPRKINFRCSLPRAIWVGTCLEAMYLVAKTGNSFPAKHHTNHWTFQRCGLPADQPNYQLFDLPNYNAPKQLELAMPFHSSQRIPFAVFYMHRKAIFSFYRSYTQTRKSLEIILLIVFRSNLKK